MWGWGTKHDPTFNFHTNTFHIKWNMSETRVHATKKCSINWILQKWWFLKRHETVKVNITYDQIGQKSSAHPRPQKNPHLNLNFTLFSICNFNILMFLKMSWISKISLTLTWMECWSKKPAKIGIKTADDEWDFWFTCQKTQQKR